MAKLADAPVLETGGVNPLQVRVLPRVPEIFINHRAIALKCGRASKTLTGGLETYIACHASIAQMEEHQCEELGAVVRIDLGAPEMFRQGGGAAFLRPNAQAPEYSEGQWRNGSAAALYAAG